MRQLVNYQAAVEADCVRALKLLWSKMGCIANRLVGTMVLGVELVVLRVGNYIFKTYSNVRCSRA